MTTTLKFNCILCLSILLTSCAVTTTKQKDPIFENIQKVDMELTSLVKAEHINLAGTETTKNKKITTELQVEITNGQNIPENEEERKALGKSIAATVKKNLKDPNQFDSYTVLFITKVENSVATKRHWVGNVFSSSEL